MDLHLLNESLFRLDGGAMFGHVPKVVWSRLIKTDDANRIQLACHPLLMRHPSGKNIIIETGMGTKWPAKDAALYALEVHSMDEMLAPHGLTRADITDVILTHLHLDHAGGATRFDESGAIVPTFPNATYYVQRGEWDAAQNPDIRSRPSYRAQDYDPIPQEQWRFLQGDTQLFESIGVRVTPGHTRFHQSVFIEEGERTVIFFADIVPTTRHIKPHWVMGYDLYPLDVMAVRARLFDEAIERNAICIFEHDPDVPIARIVRDGKGFAVNPAAL